MTPAVFDTLAADYREKYLLGTITRDEARELVRRFLGLTEQVTDELLKAWDDVMAEARRIEKHEIECSCDFIYTRPNSAEYQRLQALSRGARPSPYHVKKVLEARRAVAA